MLCGVWRTRWQVREADASIVRMVDTQDVHTLRYEREALLKENPQVHH